MAQFNKKGKYLTAEVRFRYNEREGVIELTSKDPDLSAKGFMHRIYPDAQAGTVVLSELEKHMPELKGALTPPSFPNGPLLLPDEVGDPFKIPLGTGEKNEEILWDVNKHSHALIAGNAGSGKSIARTVIYRHLKKHPADWSIFGVDPSDSYRADHLESEMGNTTNIGHSYAAAMFMANGLRKSLEKGRDFSSKIMFIIENFSLLMESYEADGNLKLPLDKRQYEYDLMEDLLYIARYGGVQGVHLCIVTQQTPAAAVPPSLKHALPLRYGLGKHSNTASLMLMDSIAAARLEGSKAGQGVVSTLDGGDTYIQGYYPLPNGK